MTQNTHLISPTMMDQTVEQLARDVINGQGQLFVPIFYGGPGVGKSRIPHDVSSRLGMKFVDTRLSYHDSTDFAVPMKNSRGKLQFMSPEEIENIGADGEPTLWMLDEFTHANPPTQSVAFKMVLDRVVGYTKIPDNVLMVSAANPVPGNSYVPGSQDLGGLYDLKLPLKDRFTKYALEPEVDGWCDWAEQVNLPPVVINYIRWAGRKALCDYDDRDFPVTPRGWERVGRIMQRWKGQSFVWPSIYGTLNKQVASDFRAFYNLKGDVPSVQQVINDPTILEGFYNDRMDMFYSLRSTIESDCSPTQILDIVDGLSHNEVRFQLVKPMAYKIFRNDDGSKNQNEKLLMDNNFMSRLLDTISSMNTEQQQLLTKVFGFNN